MRGLAIACGLAPTVVCGVLAGGGPPVWTSNEFGPALATVLGVGVLAIMRRGFATGTFAIVLAALAAHLATIGRVELDLAVGRTGAYDLQGAPIPADPPAFIAVRGHFRPEWTLDEYAAEPGTHPDQSQPPHAVIVPLMPNPAGVVASAGPIVLARLAAKPEPSTQAEIVRGRATIADPTLVTTLVEVDGRPPGIVIDALAPPSVGGASIRLSIAAGLAALAALAWAWVARPASPRPRATDGSP